MEVPVGGMGINQMQSKRPMTGELWSRSQDVYGWGVPWITPG